MGSSWSWRYEMPDGNCDTGNKFTAPDAMAEIEARVMAYEEVEI